MKCKEIQEQGNVNSKLQNKKKQKLKERGITLIALVVTIIILLILAGVTLNMALSGDGLFSRARNAADKYKKAQEEEQELISEIGKEMNSEYVGEYVTGYTPKNNTEGCTIETNISGRDIEQTFKTSEEKDMKWRIWSYDGTTLTLILDKPTAQKLSLTNLNGYNNGTWAMNKICRECFGQDVPGVTVRNLARSDIEKVSNYDYTKYVDSISKHYGETKTYTSNNQAPAMWNNHDSTWNYEYGKGIGEASCEIPWEQEYERKTENGANNKSAQAEFRQSFYEHDYNGKENEFYNSKYFELIFRAGVNDEHPDRYWLATRFVSLSEDKCYFGFCGIDATDSRARIVGWEKFESNRFKSRAYCCSSPNSNNQYEVKWI